MIAGLTIAIKGRGNYSGTTILGRAENHIFLQNREFANSII